MIRKLINTTVKNSREDIFKNICNLLQCFTQNMHLLNGVRDSFSLPQRSVPSRTGSTLRTEINMVLGGLDVCPSLESEMERKNSRQVTNCHLSDLNNATLIEHVPNVSYTI